MAKVKFSKMYDHTFIANRTMMNFPEGWEGTLKPEVYDGARAAGALEGVKPLKVEPEVDAATDTSATPQAPGAPLTDARGAGNLHPPSDSE